MSNTLVNTRRGRSIQVSASPESVFAALTEAARLQAWFCSHAEIEPHPGGRYACWGPEIYGAPSRESATQRILSVDEGKALCLDWPVEGFSKHWSYEISNSGNGSKVEGWQELIGAPEGPTWEGAVDQIMVALYNLRNYVEKGTPLFRLNLTDKANSVVVSVTIQADPKDAFAALVEPDALKKWIESDNADTNPMIGGKYTYGWDQTIEGEKFPMGPTKILRLEPGHVVKTDWFDDGKDGSEVEWSVEAQGSGAKVTIHHSGFWAGARTDMYNAGWAAFLGNLKSLLEGTSPATKLQS